MTSEESQIENTSDIDLNNIIEDARDSRIFKNHRRKYKLDYDSIILEDIEDQEIDVHLNNYGQLFDEDLLDFIGIYFSNEFMAQDAFQIKHSTNPEINRHGARILWVESTQTGDMVPVERHISTQDIEANNTSSVIPNEESGGDLEDTRAIEEDHVPLLAIPPPPLALEPTFATTATRLGQQMNSSDLLESDSSTSMMKSAVINRGGFNNKQGGGDILESSIAPIVAYHNMVMVQRGIFLVFQGLLAGFSFTSEFIYQSSNGDDTNFVTTYQPIAQYFRRFFYILATISLVGSLDMCLTIFNSSSFQRRNRDMSSSNNYNNHRAIFAMSLNYDLSSFLLSLLIGLLYATAFIMTILMSQFDVLTSLKDDVSIWPEEALQDSQYSSCLSEWKGLNTARLITSVLAWMGSCLFVWKDLIQLNAKSADLLRLREVTLAWSGRVKAMEGGSGIDKLNPNELRKLIAIMKVGIDRAKDALSFFEQQNDENISQKNK